MITLFKRLAESVSRALTLEDLARPLLELLEEVTEFESTYLTTIDLAAGTQRVLYARNTETLQIPEGLTVPWQDTLCKRALDEGRMFTDNVGECWGDSQAAAALGIETYLSIPIYAGKNTLYGTLCAVSASRRSIDDHARHVLSLFATLIGSQIERERLLVQLLEANTRLSDLATTDPLTGLPNRRALMELLQRQMSLADQQNLTTFIAFLDLDDFKDINDCHGHAVGDQFLAAMGSRLRGALRGQDIVARYGGDEFVVTGPGPAPGAEVESALRTFTDRIFKSTIGRFSCEGTSIDYGGSSVGAIAVLPRTLDPLAALTQADQAMYRVKLARRAERQLPRP